MVKLNVINLKAQKIVLHLPLKKLGNRRFK
jgi:hypothetical protein